jgi:hypothetical protein
VSLILEALRKLEREKQTPERGLLVVGATEWQKAPTARAPLLLFLLGLTLGAALLGALRWRGQGAPSPEPSPESRGPAPVAAPAATPAPRPAAPAPEAAAAPSPAAARPAAAPTPPAAEAPSAPAFTLQAISERDGHPVAIVNERLVREGDSIDGALIVKIGAGQVEIEVAGRRSLLKF